LTPVASCACEANPGRKTGKARKVRTRAKEPMDMARNPCDASWPPVRQMQPDVLDRRT